MEYQLTDELLRIDALVIKKLKDIEITKSIGRIFTRYNSKWSLRVPQGPSIAIKLSDVFTHIYDMFLYKLIVPKEEFDGIEIINSELIKEFKGDRKGILDVRVRTKLGNRIDVEIQILPTEYMAERTIFYWSKMYTSQIKPGDTYDKLKKCVTQNMNSQK